MTSKSRAQGPKTGRQSTQPGPGTPDPPYRGVGRIESIPDISAIPDDELLANLVARVPRPTSTPDLWIAADGYYPGSTRVSAHELHARYCEWMAQQPDLAGEKPMHLVRWGVVMAGRFKKVRGRNGIYYLISRSPTIE